MSATDGSEDMLKKVAAMTHATETPITDAPLAERRDKGPWRAGVTDDKRVFVESADFTHDVRLYIDGDFANLDQKVRYATGIANQLSTPAVQLRADDDGYRNVIASLGAALRKLSFHAQTTGGTAGPDSGLQDAIAEAERALSMSGIGKAFIATSPELRTDGVVGIDWSMVRSILMQGAAIQQDYQAGKFATYEHYSARMDAAARERIDELSASPAAAKEYSPNGVKRQDVCVWMEDSNGTWDTSCGKSWEFTDGGPVQNAANFCHHCGGHLLPESYADDAINLTGDRHE